MHGGDDGEGVSEGNGEGSDGAVAKNTGSHCGEQATPRTGSYVFKLRGKAADVRVRKRATRRLFLEQPRAINMSWSKNAQCPTRGAAPYTRRLPKHRGLLENATEDGGDAEKEECASPHLWLRWVGL